LLDMFARRHVLQERHQAIGGCLNDVLITFQRFNTEQPVVIGRLIARWYAQPLVIRIEVICHWPIAPLRSGTGSGEAIGASSAVSLPENWLVCPPSTGKSWLGASVYVGLLASIWFWIHVSSSSKSTGGKTDRSGRSLTASRI